MSEVSFENRDFMIQLGLTIASLRRARGLSQEALAEKANISRSFLSSIEAPGLAVGFGVETFINIAKAFDMEASELMRSAELYEQILGNKEEIRMVK